MHSSSEDSFLQQLEHQAAQQAKLERQRFLPRQLDPLTSFIGTHPWQVLLAVSGITAVLLEIV